MPANIASKIGYGLPTIASATPKGHGNDQHEDDFAPSPDAELVGDVVPNLACLAAVAFRYGHQDQPFYVGLLSQPIG
ncbi:MAG: hypothetical protein ACREJM_06775 [Candidatus Saccharimonadales bacterium]